MAATATGKKYELASAFVSIMPSLEGVAAAISRELSRGVADAPIEQGVQQKLAKAVEGVKLGDISAQLFKGSAAAIAPLNSALSEVVRGVGVLFGDTLTLGAKAAGLALAGATAAIGTQIVAGGFSRALGINEATAGLKAMGYEGAQFTKIMDAAGAAVDGTAYSMDQSVLAARNFISSGVPEEKLEGYLKNIGKLADMGTRSYGDISTMLQSMAATDIVQGGDFLQLAQAGIPIYTAMAKTLGVSVAEVKKLGSAGKITFADLNDGIEAIKWDSAVSAALDVGAAWGNVKAQLSKLGANLWTPVIDGLPEILSNVRTFISVFNKTFDFNPIQVKIAGTLDKIGSIFDDFKDIDGKLNSSKVAKYVTDVVDKFKNLSTKLDQYKPVIIGAIIGISGSLISGIPIIGPIFAGLTPIVGVFAGVLYSAYQNSEDLRNAIGGLKNVWLGLSDRLFKSSSNFDAGSFFKEIGDGLASAIGWIQNLIVDFIDAMAKNMPHIKETISTMMESIGGMFKTAGENGLDGEAIATIFTQIIDIFGTYAPVAFKVLLTAAAMVGDIVKSDWFNVLVSWLGSAFSAISANETMIQAGLKVAAVIFIGGKLLPVFAGIITFMQGFGRMAPAMSAAGTAAPVVAGSMKTFLLGITKILVIAALIIAAIVGIGFLMEKTGFMQYLNIFVDEVFLFLNGLAQGWARIVETMLPMVTLILQMVTGLVIQLIDGLIQAIAKPMLQFLEVIGEIIAKVTDAQSGLVEAKALLVDSQSGLVDSISGLLQFLAKDGQAAGEGAWAAAKGLGALLAIVANESFKGVAANGLGSVISSLTGGEGASTLDNLISTIDKVTKLTAISDTFPAVFSQMLILGADFGLRFPGSISEGIMSGAPAIAAALSSAILTALQAQQTFLDANPLEVRLKVDNTALETISAGSNQNSGGFQNFRTNNYQLNSSNDGVITKFINDARGR